MKQLRPQARTDEERAARVRRYLRLRRDGLTISQAEKRVHSNRDCLRAWAEKLNLPWEK